MYLTVNLYGIVDCMGTVITRNHHYLIAYKCFMSRVTMWHLWQLQKYQMQLHRSNIIYMYMYIFCIYKLEDHLSLYR